MRHRKASNRLGRETSHRTSMMRNMVTSLLKHGRLETTEAKAKQLRAITEKMITLAKRGDLHARRQVLSYIRDKATAHGLFEEQKSAYLDRQGGYLRILKKGFRKGDGAAVSIVQLLHTAEPEDKDKKSDKKTKATSGESRGEKGKAKKIKKEGQTKQGKRRATGGSADS